MTEICRQLHVAVRGLALYRFPFEMQHLPENGVYVLFERGEIGHGGQRIVQVGTHTGPDQLRTRLQEHFVRENKDRSIFRKNIGRALLMRDEDPFLEQWELDLTPRQARQEYRWRVDLEKQAEVENVVSAVIQYAFSFAVIPHGDKEARLKLKARLIATVSLCRECRPSASWLGRYSPKVKIRESGLWQEQHLYKKPMSLEELKALTDRMAGQS